MITKNQYKDLTIVVPTFNEEENTPDLLDILLKLYPNSNILIVDEGSKDKTQEIIMKYRSKNRKINLIDRKNKRIHGLTASVLEGILATKTTYFCVIDGDLQHPPEKIKEIYRSLKNNQIVIGTRKKVISSWPLHRKIISKTANTMAQIRLRLNNIKVKDPMSGFFGMDTKLAKEIIKSNGMDKFELVGYKILFDLLKKADPSTKIGEIHYNFGLRTKGESKIGVKHIISFFKSVFD